jgi:hypothetical protein
MEPNNPGGSGTPAGNTMSVQRQISGGRTRNVVNLALPGSTTTKAYELTAANSVPNAATDGVANFHSQKTLHVLIHNNGLVHSSGDLTVSAIAIWGYNSSLGGIWTKLTSVQRANNADTLVYAEYSNLSVAKDVSLRLIIPIEGIERIAVRAETFSHTRSGGSLDIYLGANTI